MLASEAAKLILPVRMERCDKLTRWPLTFTENRYGSRGLLGRMLG
jgi:hypothetical protein